MATKKRVKKESDETVPRLEVKPFPPGLLERIKGMAGLIGMDRNEFVIELLRQETKRLQPIQHELKQWWKERRQRFPPDEENDDDNETPRSS